MNYIQLLAEQISRLNTQDRSLLSQLLGEEDKEGYYTVTLIDYPVRKKIAFDQSRKKRRQYTLKRSCGFDKVSAC